MSQLRILVADDNQSMRMAYKKILETQDEFEVVGMASDGKEAIEQAMALIPDVAILDIVMPIIDGIEVAHRIIDRHPGTSIVIISAYDDLDFVSAIMRDGAKRRAYILKSSLADISELVRVVEAVANGQIVLDSRIVRRLLSLDNRQSGSVLASLTETEENVLKLMLEGRDKSYITQALGLQQEEMEAKAASAYAKLGVTAQNWVDGISSAVQALVNQSAT